ncbi:MAG: UDP-galactopyranose mutase [Promethearchaeota archaeon]
MKILIIGAGFTGCTLARLLKDMDHQIYIKEKLDHIGGLSYTKKSPNGIIYGPYGAHVFHTSNKDIINFVKRFAKFNSYVHYKGIIINNIIRPFPISLETIKNMPEARKILKELKNRPDKLNRSNFEECMISLIGKTLYNLFVRNYTKKMWGIEPKELTAEWAPKRIEMRDSNSELFKGQWQGLPIEGYSKFFEEMLTDIEVELNCNGFNKSDYDLVLFSGRIDELLNFKFGALPYRSLKYEYRTDEVWENDKFGSINLPQHSKYIRKSNFKILYQQKISQSWIQYQESIPADDSNLPMYPITTINNHNLFERYLNEVCKSGTIIPVGRLGLYKYLDMDKAVSLSMDMIPLILNWKKMSHKKKYFKIKEIIVNY